MSQPLRTAALTLAAFASTGGVTALTALPHEGRFLAESRAAMTRMMAHMAAAPTGDVDRDFVAMMVPHHRAAIEMAASILKYGRNEQLKRIAHGINVEQQQEIAAMRLAVGLPPALEPAPADRRHLRGRAAHGGMR